MELAFLIRERLSSASKSKLSEAIRGLLEDDPARRRAAQATLIYMEQDCRDEKDACPLSLVDAMPLGTLPNSVEEALGALDARAPQPRGYANLLLGLLPNALSKHIAFLAVKLADANALDCEDFGLDASAILLFELEALKAADGNLLYK